MNTPEHQVKVDRHIIVHVVSLLSRCSGTLLPKSATKAHRERHWRSLTDHEDI
jgi:hypothetical protein